MKKSAQRGGQQKSEAEENCELCESAGPGWLECREFNKCDNVERQAKKKAEAKAEALAAENPPPMLGKIPQKSAFNTQLGVGGKRRSRKAKKAKKTKKRRAKKSRKTRTSRR
jgi:hypothetical protein